MGVKRVFCQTKADFNFSVAPSWMPEEPYPEELAEVEYRKETIRLRNQQKGIGDCDELPSGVRSTGIREFHLPAPRSVRSSKLFLDDIQEDHWGTSYARNHCVHFIKHYPGYSY